MIQALYAWSYCTKHVGLVVLDKRSFSIFKETDSWLNDSSSVGLVVLGKAFTTESESWLKDSSNVDLVVLD